MKRGRHVTIRKWAILSSVLLGAGVVSGYEIDWYTIDGGGQMWATGGDFELSVTAGQPDASEFVMTGGDFELTGGFWAPFAPGPPPVTPSAVEPGGPAEPKEPEPAP
jgi:hypothetical protein